jgi:hypothetical protein
LTSARSIALPAQDHQVRPRHLRQAVRTHARPRDANTRIELLVESSPAMRSDDRLGERLDLFERAVVRL